MGHNHIAYYTMGHIYIKYGVKDYMTWWTKISFRILHVYHNYIKYDVMDLEYVCTCQLIYHSNIKCDIVDLETLHTCQFNIHSNIKYDVKDQENTSHRCQVICHTYI